MQSGNHIDELGFSLHILLSEAAQWIDDGLMDQSSQAAPSNLQFRHANGSLQIPFKIQIPEIYQADELRTI